MIEYRSGDRRRDICVANRAGPGERLIVAGIEAHVDVLRPGRGSRVKGGGVIAGRARGNHADGSAAEIRAGPADLEAGASRPTAVGRGCGKVHVRRQGAGVHEGVKVVARGNRRRGQGMVEDVDGDGASLRATS